MIDDAYFQSLDGCPSDFAVCRLPSWAAHYEKQLRAVARWWSIRNVRNRPRCPTIEQPSHGAHLFADRVATLPLWAQDWFRTLRFEIWWQQQQVSPMVTGPSRLKLFVGRRRQQAAGSCRVRGAGFQSRRISHARPAPQA